MGRTATDQIRFFARLVICIAFVGFFAGRAVAGQTGFVYALQQVNGGANQIHGFRIDETTGALTAIAGFPVSSGGTGALAGGVEQLAYFNGRLFVVNNGDNTLTVFSVNASTGALTAMPYSPVALDGNCLRGHPSCGSPVVVETLPVSLRAFARRCGKPRPGVRSRRACAVRAAAQGGTLSTAAAIAARLPSPDSASYGGTAVLRRSPDRRSIRVRQPARIRERQQRITVQRTSAAAGAGLHDVRRNPDGGPGNLFARAAGSRAGVLHPGGFIVADRSGNAVGVFQIIGAGSATTLTAIGDRPLDRRDLHGGDR